MSQRPRRVDLQRDFEPEQPQSTTITVHSELDEDELTVLVVDSPGNFDLETMGVNERFYPDRLEIMKARALAFGYTLERRD
jgi:hypothetical protein